MKKIAFIIVAVIITATANAQFVMGVQGGFLWQKDANSINTDYNTASSWIGGLDLGYRITPKLYVGIKGGLLGNASEVYTAIDTVYYEQVGMDIAVKDHRIRRSRMGWNGNLVVKYEVLKYGNMHFNMLLQGGMAKWNATDSLESYVTTPYPNPDEYREIDPGDNGITATVIGVNLRPTLTYEFSRHLEAELTLDFLSIGWQSSSVNDAIRDESHTSTCFYGGINTFRETLQWESPMLRLGFNFTF